LVIGLYGKMERKSGYLKMINHSTKIQRTKTLPLRWIGNISGEFAGNHIVKCVNMDEDQELGWRYKYHAFMWKYLNKPYEWWGTYYMLDMAAWKEELDQTRIAMADEGWDDYDTFGKAYWEKEEE
jgi:hypothetical protein